MHRHQARQEDDGVQRHLLDLPSRHRGAFGKAPQRVLIIPGCGDHGSHTPRWHYRFGNEQAAIHVDAAAGLGQHPTELASSEHGHQGP